jgi:Tfp pilus assembly protein FimV
VAISPRHNDKDALVYAFPAVAVRRHARREAMLARRRRSALVALSAIVLAAGLKGASVARPEHLSRPEAPATVTVRPGDTVWDLAGRFAAPGTDSRAYVDAVIRLNRTDGKLLPGTRLQLPK